MMNDQTKKPPLRMPVESPQLIAATEKDSCYDVPKVGTEEWKQLQADVQAYWDAKKAGKIPQYPDLAPPGW